MPGPADDTPSLARRTWTWLGAQGLTALGVAAILAGAAAILFGAANLMRDACDDPCSAGWSVPAGTLETLGFVAVLGGIAAVGHWIGQIAHHTWLERMQLELDAGDPDPDRKERLQRLTSQPHASEIQRRARLSLWTSAPVTALSAVMLPSAMGYFAEAALFAPYLLPIILLTSIAGAAATIRGIILLAAARRLARPRPAPAAET